MAVNLNNPDDLQLLQTIEKADEQTLRLVLRQACYSSEEMKKFVANALHVDVYEYETTPPGATKRKKVGAAPRYVKCGHCDNVYDVEKNKTDAYKEACVWHPGDLEEDPEHDYDQWEREEWELDPEDNPEVFTWTCCGKKADGEGCKKGRHSDLPRGSLLERSELFIAAPMVSTTSENLQRVEDLEGSSDENPQNSQDDDY